MYQRQRRTVFPSTGRADRRRRGPFRGSGVPEKAMKNDNNTTLSPEKPVQAHFSGIKGVGMTALALYLQDRGHPVSGSDLEEKFVTQDILRRRNIPLTPLTSPIPPQTSLLIFSGAHRENPQVRIAREQGIQTLSYAVALAQFTQ